MSGSPGTPENNAFEQTVGTTRSVEAPTAAQRERWADIRGEDA